MTTGRDGEEHRCTGSGHHADRNAQGLQGEEADQQYQQRPPTHDEGGAIANGRLRLLQRIEGIALRQVTPEEQEQHEQGGRNAGQAHRYHHRGVLGEAQPEIVGGNDVHQVGHHQRQAGGVGDEPGGHDESQGRGGREAQGDEHGHDDRSQDQRRAVIGEQRRNSRPQQHAEAEQAMAAAPGPARYVQGCPLEEARLIQQQADDDHGNEGSGGIPDDGPHHGDVLQRHRTDAQGDGCADGGAPAHTEALGLPDDQHEGEDEYGNGNQHGGLVQGIQQQAASRTGRPSMFCRRERLCCSHSALACSVTCSISCTQAGSCGLRR